MASATRDWRILVLASGSVGDVYPALAIAQALRHGGHRVLFGSNPYFEAAVRHAGLDFAPISTAEEYLSGLNNRDLWQAGKGYKVFFDNTLREMPEVYDLIAANYVAGESIVVAPFAMLGARVANEKLGVPLAQYHVGIAGLRSYNGRTGLTPPGVSKLFIRPMRKLLTSALDRYVLDPVIAPRLNTFRAQLGMPPIHKVLDQWIHSPQMRIGLFPPWFLPPQPDWPPNTYQTGFLLFDYSAAEEMPAEVLRFLDKGDPPLVFTWGTAMRFSGKLMEASIEVCRLTGRRGLFLTPFAGQVPHLLPDGVRHFEYVPLSALLPRAAALIHHGGIGTMAQAFSAGIPQLITPFNFDQPMNAEQVRRLGAGDSIPARQYEPGKAARKLQNLLSSPDVAERCRLLKTKMKATDALGQACRWIESLMVAAP